MKTMIVSSLEKVFWDQQPEQWNHPSLTLLSNERGAFQAAFCCEGPGTVSVSLSGVPKFESFQVVSVPSSYPCHEQRDPLYVRTQPGLYPDLLKPMTLPAMLQAKPGSWQAVWISFQDLTPGTYEIKVTIDGQILTLPLHVLPQCLPPQTLYHTEWFHGDCLADYYGAEVFSEDHWQAIEGFLKGAARCGVNMLLTPVFTPPLDTEPGGERTTIQLVDVEETRDGYLFSFGKLRRWIGLCQKYGITEIEFSHLFTQWGASAAPKILVRKNGKWIRKFGWNTDPLGEEYRSFLRQFLKALKAEMEAIGIWEHCWFHISDEPSEDQKESYRAAKESISDLLPEQRCIDALSSFEFFQNGIIRHPVVCEDHIEPFVKAGVEGLWTYYCTAQGVKVPNRFFSMPSGRNRILGTLLYVYDLKGFLHWGLNFYNSQFSKAHIDPFGVTDAGGAFPSGDPFLLYPAPDKTAWLSIRSEVLQEGLQDLRLLKLAEEKLGRQKVLSLLDEIAGAPMTFETYPTGEDFFYKLRETFLPWI